MQKIKPYLSVCVAAGAVLALCACTSNAKMVSVEPKPAASAQSVVLMDPTADDSMIPTVAQSLSRGAVTVYSLESAPPAPVVPLVSAPVTAQKLNPVASVNLKKPTGADGGSDPRVTVFDVDSPVPVPKVEKKAELPLIPDTILPPVSSVGGKLDSPFDKDGKIKLAAPEKPLPFRKTVSEKQKAAPVTEVTEETLLDAPVGPVSVAPSMTDPVAAPIDMPAPATAAVPAKRRPPQGMTY